MNVLDKIKELINKITGKNKPKLLTDGTNPINENNNKKRFMESIKFNNQNTELAINQPVNEIQYKEGTLEAAIEQYVSAVGYYSQQNKNVSSYNVLTSLYAMSNQSPGQNLEKEQELMKYLKSQPDKYSIYEQGQKGVSFYHIKSQTQMPYDKADTVRFYINTKRENIADLSGELVKEFGDEPFYFKFIADNQLDKRARTESVVIYEHSKNINRTLSIIEKIKQRNPKLFELSDKQSNPFLKKTCENVVSYAPEVSGEYVDSNFKKQKIAASFNTELAVALGEAYIQATYEVLIKNQKVLNHIDRRFIENMDKMKELISLDNNKPYDAKINQSLSFFAQVYPQIAEKNKDDLIHKIRGKLIATKIRNPELDINTEMSIKRNKQDFER